MSTPNTDPHKTNIKVRDMVLLKKHIPTTQLDVKYKTSYWICKWISDKAFDIQDST